ncbi:MAG TPA: branched-chain amino acid ABC transporter permease [Ramlibacter sp.]|uniref:branched-chain amino acid ABC transporter permease n=1 Tax=Ramlibacter sp. TaxID=1917967 RepID=UPI002B9D03C8|nr:branched-chain amino acid ABC transporter permease [Ramlibacter sp.]HVZ45507.1 branched-chain amino acid ABC transporter permease [Ramlibacter sp.]
MIELAIIGVRGLGLGSLYALVAMSLNMVFRSTGVVNFAQGEILILGGVFAFMTTGLGWISKETWIAGLVASGLLSAVLLALQGQVTLWPMRTSRGQESWLVTTMAASIIMVAVLLKLKGPWVQSVDSVFDDMTILGVGTPAAYGALALLALGWYAALRLFLSRTITGLAMSALAQDIDAARAAGLNVNGLQLLSFAISGVIVGTAGFAAAPVLSVAPDTGTRYLINGFLAAVFGGMGNDSGALVAGPIVGVLGVLVAFKLGGEFQDMAMLLILVAILLLRPQGLFGRPAARRV